MIAALILAATMCTGSAPCGYYVWIVPSNALVSLEAWPNYEDGCRDFDIGVREDPSDDRWIPAPEHCLWIAGNLQPLQFGGYSPTDPAHADEYPIRIGRMVNGVFVRQSVVWIPKAGAMRVALPGTNAAIEYSPVLARGITINGVKVGAKELSRVPIGGGWPNCKFAAPSVVGCGLEK